ncbi:Hypothetical predicted protein, partial [Pelobates cultripes]
LRLKPVFKYAGLHPIHVSAHARSAHRRGDITPSLRQPRMCVPPWNAGETSCQREPGGAGENLVTTQDHPYEDTPDAIDNNSTRLIGCPGTSNAKGFSYAMGVDVLKNLKC